MTRLECKLPFSDKFVGKIGDAMPMAASSSGADAALIQVDSQIGIVEAQLSRLYATRNSLANPGKAKVDGEPFSNRCAFPPSANLSHWRGTDVKMPVPWCEASSQPPPSRSLDELALEWQERRKADPSQRPLGAIPVLPSLIVPCCAHSGTTFLWRCMEYAFHPKRVCGHLGATLQNPTYAERQSDWTADRCARRRYLLPGLTGNIEGHYGYRKEWFFYGGGSAAWNKGWQDYVGVELPLCYWEPEFMQALRERPLDDTLAHARRLCMGPSHSHDARACLHRACIPLDLHKVRLSPAYEHEYNKATMPRWQYQATKALPRVVPTSHSGAVVSDMTPNYLCAPKALRNLAGSVGAPAHWRLLLLMRPPLSMLTASYKMFVRWGWVRVYGETSPECL
jgi:hypothetical protein